MYYFLKSFAFMVSSLNERSVKAVSWGITFLGFDILRLRRKVVLQNLRIAFKPKVGAIAGAFGSYHVPEEF